MKSIPYILTLAAVLVSMAAAQDQEPPKPKEERKRQREQAKEQENAARERAEQAKERLEMQRDIIRDRANGAALPVPPLPPEVAMDGGVFEFNGLDHNFNFALGGDNRSAAPALVVLNKQDAGIQNDMQEDLAVMNRILSKATLKESDRDPGDRALGIMLSTANGKRRPQAMYLEGFGAVFMLSVRFPLVPPPVKEDTKNEAPKNSTWEQNKRELFGGKDKTRSEAFRMERDERPLEYDGDKVDQLREDLLAALENGTNIRHLKPDEAILITVMGGASAPGRVRTVAGNPGNGRQTRIAIATVGVGGAAASSSTMTLKVKKSDVDAFAAGKMKLEELKKVAQVQTY